MIAKQVKCSKCGYVGEYDEFPKGHDFFQNAYIAGCPKCDNSQTPGDASMRMFGGERPFTFVKQEKALEDPLSKVLHNAEEAS